MIFRSFLTTENSTITIHTRLADRGDKKVTGTCYLRTYPRQRDSGLSKHKAESYKVNHVTKFLETKTENKRSRPQVGELTKTVREDTSKKAPKHQNKCRESSKVHKQLISIKLKRVKGACSTVSMASRKCSSVHQEMSFRRRDRDLAERKI
jgi:hypothetical protein